MHLYFLYLVEENKWNNGKDSLFGFTIVHNTLKKKVKWFSNGKIVNAFFVHIFIILLSLNLGGLKFVSLGRKWLTPFSFFFFFFSPQPNNRNLYFSSEFLYPFLFSLFSHNQTECKTLFFLFFWETKNRM